MLWADGVSTVTPEQAVDLILRGHPVEKLAVTELTPDVKRFNAVEDVPLGVKTGVDPSLFPPKWTLPDRYKYLDLDGYLLGLSSKIEKDELYEKRLERLSEEIWLFKERKLDDVLRVLIYVVDVLTENDSVWGVGRGSSCSSYLLYLIGLHAVDVVKYDVDVRDFIR